MKVVAVGPEQTLEGAVPVGELVTSRHPLEDAAARFAELRRPGTEELEVLLAP